MGKPADEVTLEAIDKANAAIDAANPSKVAAAPVVEEKPTEAVNPEKKARRDGMGPMGHTWKTINRLSNLKENYESLREVLTLQYWCTI